MRKIWTAAALTAVISLTSVTAASAAVPLREASASRAVAAPASLAALKAAPADTAALLRTEAAALKAEITRLTAHSATGTRQIPPAQLAPIVTAPNKLLSDAQALLTALTGPATTPASIVAAVSNLVTDLTTVITSTVTSLGLSLPGVDTSGLLSLVSSLLNTVKGLLAGLGLPVSVPPTP